MGKKFSKNILTIVILTLINKVQCLKNSDRLCRKSNMLKFEVKH